MPERPLTAAQQGIWLGQQLDPTSPAYNAGECVEIEGSLDRVLFERALRQAVAETEALHCRFLPGEDGPRQVIATAADWLLPVIDLTRAADPWGEVQAWTRRDLATVVDLQNGPLFGHVLFRAVDRWYWWHRAHHIALDGVGFSMFARRVAALYTAFEKGEAPPPSGRLQPVIDADAAYHASPDLSRDRTFWLDRLADCEAPVSLSAGHAPPARQSLRRTAWLEPSVVGALQSLASAAWPEAFIAGLAGYVQSQTDADEVVLGLPVMNRMGTAAARVPCMAMNIVPLRIAVGGGLLDTARGVAAELKRIRPHQRYRYEQLRRDLKRVGGGRRLFGPVVNLMPFDAPLRFGDRTARVHNISAGPVEDISFGLYAKGDDRWRLDVDANPARYDEAAVAAHQQGFVAWLEESLAAPERGRARTAVSLSDGGPLPMPPRPVLELLWDQAHRRPDAVALVHGDEELGYGALLAAVRRLAGAMAAAGVAPGRTVAVALPRGIDAVVAMLAAFWCGAVYLPLDPQGPASRRRTILDDARPALTLTPGALAELRRTDAAVLPEPRQAELAYLLYTSGSTGTPKGVLIGHVALAHYLAGAGACYGVTADDRVLQFAPLHFDASLEEILVTLCVGATLVLRTEAMLDSMSGFLAACAEARISVLDLPTTFWHELAYSLSHGAALPTCVRTVIIGGEAVLPERVERWHRAVGGRVRLLNTYGPTEATIVATVDELTAGDAVTIGRPMPGVRAAVLDGRGQPVRIGAEGELYLLGETLADGYLGRRDLTDERFVRLDCLSGRPRGYRTGDRVRQRPDGRLVYIGRVDDEFKISGHRVDPAEIELALLRYPGMREAAVVGIERASGGKQLVAHVVVEPAATAAQLRAHLLGLVPAAVVPSAFVPWQRLPRTASNKIDRRALRDNADEPAEPDPATSPFERQVLQVWQEVLGRSGLSPDDDFFDLGGQSLQAIQVATRLSAALVRDVPVTLLFQQPTAARLAQALAAADDAGSSLAPMLTLRPGTGGTPLFCIHPAAGLSWCYLELARRLGSAHPVYGLQAAGLSMPQSRPASLAAMADDYFARIRRVQPHGPYCLLGWSLGGAVAHLIAERLQAIGEAVELLAMLDAYPASEWCGLPPPGEQEALVALLDVAGSAAPDGELRRADVVAALHRQGGPLAALGEAGIGALVEVALGNMRLFHACKFGVFDGDILFFAAGRRSGGFAPRPQAWRPHLTGELRIETLDCPHGGMLGPQALTRIVPTLGRCLDSRPPARHKEAL